MTKTLVDRVSVHTERSLKEQQYIEWFGRVLEQTRMMHAMKKNYQFGDVVEVEFTDIGKKKIQEGVPPKKFKEDKDYVVKITHRTYTDL